MIIRQGVSGSVKKNNLIQQMKKKTEKEILLISFAYVRNFLYLCTFFVRACEQ